VVSTEDVTCYLASADGVVAFATVAGQQTLDEMRRAMSQVGIDVRVLVQCGATGAEIHDFYHYAIDVAATTGEARALGAAEAVAWVLGLGRERPEYSGALDSAAVVVPLWRHGRAALRPVPDGG
jgi:hypothetical protein